MRKLALALPLVLWAGLACAQSPAFRTVQSSQDPTGPLGLLTGLNGGQEIDLINAPTTASQSFAFYQTITNNVRQLVFAVGITPFGGNGTQCLHVNNAGLISPTGSGDCSGAGGITVGTTPVNSATNTDVLFNNNGTLGQYGISGTGSVCMTTNCALTTPNLGTPSALVLTNASGLPAVGYAGRQAPVVCEINTTSATTCNNGGSAANNGTYTTPTGALYLKGKMIGGGGGAGGSGTAAGGDGTNGSPTCWNTSGAACTTPVYQASGGAKGTWSTAAGGIGGGTAGSSTCAVSITGQSGQAQIHGNSISVRGSPGGGSSIGGGGAAGVEATAGENGIANTGGGGQGGGAGSTASEFTGSGGGGGGTCEFIISSPAASYTYSAGTSVAGGAAGTNGTSGGNGANGKLIIEAFFN